MLKASGRIRGWSLEFEGGEASREVILIAQSVPKDGRLQSYVQTGAPGWLKYRRGYENMVSSA
ncbi:unnamed protein product [Arabis nemorensis]|uniref:Uncharacterized protein n=1 Tax=Arabis nemorensis TaxID=586526 RepID=A0A565AQS5_9BRAS|nr:unnamed protein product [Arabis nemorensis]